MIGRVGGAVVGWFGLGRLNACPAYDRLNGSARFCTTFSALYMYVSKKILMGLESQQTPILSTSLDHLKITGYHSVF